MGLASSACLKVPRAADSAHPPAVSAAPAGAAEQELRSSRSLDQHFRVGEIRGYEYLQEGEPLGQVVTKVVAIESSPAPGRIELVSKVEWKGVNAAKQRLIHRFVLDIQGRLLSASSQSPALHWMFQNGPDGLELIEDNGIETPRRRKISARKDLVPLAFMSPLLLEAELVARALVEGESWSLISLSSGSVEAWSATIKARPEGGLRLHTSLGEEIDWVQGRIAGIVVPADHLEVRPLPSPVMPDWELSPLKRLSYRPAPEATFGREAFQIPPSAEDPGTLAGEWLIPSGPGPHPAILFLGPSWSADRFGFAGPPATDLGAHAWTDAFAQAGWFVGRFDEPGTGDSTPLATKGWSSDRADARRVLGAMMVDPRVDPERVVLVGHGEGAWLAWSLAEALPRHLKGILALAAPLQGISALMGNDPAAIQRLRETPSDHLPAELKWIKSAMDVQPQSLARRAPVPLCFGFAQHDAQLPIAASLQQLDAIWLQREPRFKDRRFVVPGVDHLWMPTPSRQRPAAAYEDPRPVSAVAIQSALACLRPWAGKKNMPETPLAEPLVSR